MLLRVSSVSAIIIMCFCSLAVSRKTRSIDMKISYKKLWVLLIQRDISKVTLRKEVGIAAGTMSKLNKGEEVALPILLRICDYLDCDIGDICEAVREEKQSCNQGGE